MPAWGTTYSLMRDALNLSSFNPRARVGHDTPTASTGGTQSSFNPRARVGHDNSALYHRIKAGWVSIHVPAWGTTFMFSPCLICLICFNPRARVGHDKAVASMSASIFLFQSTCPRGARHNPMRDRAFLRHVSIHVPAWGTTRASAPSPRPRSVSIHVPAWGTTPHRDTRKLNCLWFQSTCPRGARPLYCLWCQSKILCFNPRARMT